MTTIQKIRAEVERIKRSYDVYLARVTKEDILNDLDDLLYFIDTLEPEKPVPADLEKAAKNYAMRDKWTYEHFGDVVMKAVFFGAKWQEKKDQETIKLAEDHAFLAGADWQKEQMLKEAVKMYSCYDEEHNLIGFSTDYEAKGAYGQLTRIIIEKED